MSDYLTPKEAAELIPGSTIQGLAQLRHRGGGPVFLKPTERTVLYRRADIIDWLERSAYANTREAA